MLAVAKERLPSTIFHEGDFRNFELGRRYDVVSCLFSSIAYARDASELEEAVRCLARHLLPGGVLVVEGFIAPDKFQPGHVQLLCADEPDMKVTRMASGKAKDGRVQFEFHYLIGRPTGIEYFLEPHDVSLFTDDEYAVAFERAGLAVQHDPEGLEGRSLFVGVSPQ
jgi:SAM-dependent methyltransferase